MSVRQPAAAAGGARTDAARLHGAWAGRLARWPGLAACAVAGAAAALAHPPFGVAPALLGFALVLAMLELRSSERPLRSGFARGWAAGFGYLAVSTSWIGEPFLVDAAAHAWQAPFALTLVPGLIGLLWGAAGWMYAALAPRGGPARVLAFASLFGAWEWLRGHMLTGFPWDLPGEAWRAGSAPSQAASLVGAYGLSWITLVLAGAPAVLAWRDRPRVKATVLAAAALALAGLYGFGEARLRAYPMATEASGPRVRVVQPDLPEPAVVDEPLVRATLARYVRLTLGPGPRPDVVVWPEGAVPDSFNSYLAPGTPTLAMVTGAIGPGQVLLVGGTRIQAQPDGAWRYYNTLLALSRGPGGLRADALYDKHHLVPFGEYMPFTSLLGPLGLRKVISNPEDFASGPPPQPIRTPLAGVWAVVQPLICYEALFPAIAEHAARAAWIVNISDDAWFGRHQGPWQHLNLASYRAIEEGLPMVRATPTGVSAVIDGLGRTLRGPGGDLLRLAPSRAGVIDARLPPPLASTPYTRWRGAPFWLMVLAGVLPALSSAIRRRRT